MRAFLRSAGLMIVLLVILGTAVWADMIKMEVVNNTGSDIVYLFVSPGDSAHWGPDLLDSESYLENGDSHEFLVDFDGSSAKFDIMLVTDDDESYVKWNHTLSGKTARVVINASHYDGDVDLEFAQVTFVNDTGFEIYYLFFSPEDSAIWGPDILRSDVTLEDGMEYSFFVPVSGPVNFNVKAVDEDDDTYTFDISLDVDDEVYYAIDLADLDT